MESKRWKLVLFGSIGVAVDCLEWLLEQPQFEVIGVVCSREPKSNWRMEVRDRDMQQEAERLSVPILDMNDVLNLNADIGLSVRFHQILRQEHLDRFRKGVINMHGAPLPEYRGSMGNIMAILDGKDYFGVSLHLMDRGIDSGDIITVERYPITKTDTVYDLFVRSNRIGLRLIQTWLHAVMEDKVVYEDQAAACERLNYTSRTYGRKDAIKYKRIDAAMSPERIWDITRAFQFPGQEPAYLETPSGKVHLSIPKNEAEAKTATEAEYEYIGSKQR
ncbi:formyl transferase [Paenibacillus mesophilus]|uniref:methionyl-tRNA formyltransferase n=1 Tax=Paenibacillus mesophilus TaxID=2582849 RepID=UPI00110DDA23|nr:formyltransferase family protein [Paenibacillus mesophilus]TMV47512.1 formyl transferase [Paenibacillus mesophilus]